MVRETTGSSTTSYLIPEGMLLSFNRDGDTFYVSNDCLGSVRLVTDESGAVVSRFEWGAYGTLLDGSFDGVPGGMPFGWIGALGVRFDALTGLYYMRQPWYDAGVGRFISKDPIGIDGGKNLYAYVSNNPTRFIDPNGLQPVKDMQSVGKGCGEEAANTVLGGMFALSLWLVGGVPGTVGRVSMFALRGLAAAGFLNTLNNAWQSFTGTSVSGQQLPRDDRFAATGRFLTDLATMGLARTFSLSEIPCKDDLSLDFKPSKNWGTASEQYWKWKLRNTNLDRLSPEQVQRYTQGKGDVHVEFQVTMELHHKGIPQRNAGEFDPGFANRPANLDELWPWDHSDVDPYRYYTGRGPRP